MRKYNNSSLQEYNNVAGEIKDWYIHFTNGEITPTRNTKAPQEIKEKVNYYFGVSPKDLKKASSLGQLIDTTYKNKKKIPPFKKDLLSELKEMLPLQKHLLQNNKIYPQSNFVWSYFSSLLSL